MLAIILLADLLILSGVGFAVWRLRDDPLPYLIVIGTVFVFQLIVYLVLRLRSAAVASQVFIWGHWLLLVAVHVFVAASASSIYFAQILLIVIAGLLGSFRLTLTIAGLSALSNLIIYTLRTDSPMAADGMQSDPLLGWVVHSAVLLLALVMIAIYNHTLRENIQALQRNEDRFRALFDKTSDAVFLIGLDHTLIAANRHAAELLGYSEVEMIAKGVNELIAPEERREALARFDLVENDEILTSIPRTFVTKSGRRIILEVNLSLVRDRSGKPIHYQSIARNITNRVQENDRLKSTVADLAVRASTDSLTGILNRKAILEHIEAEWSRAQREDGPLSLMLLDLDNLKEINDVLGHASGDAALKHVADTLEKNKRKYDRVGRYGGDEFLAVLPGTSEAEAKLIAERIVESISNIESTGGEGWKRGLRASIGVASRKPSSIGQENLQELINRTDQAMYKAKHAGRGRVRVAA